MFAKLKKKIAEETAVAQRPGGATRIPRSVSKESVASMGADSGDDFASDGSSSREDLSSQLLRRNEQIRKLEVRLSDYAEQVRNLQKIKEKLEIALEKHQDSSMRKFQEQNETFQANRAKMAEGLALALARKDQEWSEKMDQLEKATAETQEKEKLITHLQEKVSSLEKKLEQNLSGEEHVQELLKEKTVAEQNLEATRQQLMAARSSQAKAIDILETRVKELELSLQASEEKLKHSDDVLAAQEAQIQELRELEQENAALKESKNECERSLQHHQLELKKLKEEWSQREIVSVAMAQALDEVRKQREEFQQQAANLTAVIDEKEQTLQEKTEVILQKEQEIFQLKKGHDSALSQMHQLQSELESLQSLRAEESEAAARDDVLRLPSPEQGLTLSVPEPHVTSRATQDPMYQLPAAERIPNGEVGVMDLGQLQKEKQDLEQQLLEKNKTIKQMQQRMLELKKTLQKELKIRPDNELFEVRDKPGPEMPNMAPSVTNNADLTDAREINFEYLKHVVLKFMSCRESEAFHLIKAVSVLLNFSEEEENMLKETLEYKMSWFGSKPAPKGSIRPSISNPRIPWS
ncbi:golgin subfamily A member 1 isoform X3 [Halichoerus grypus]